MVFIHLKGKLLNVKDLSIDRVFRNEEINNIKKILGLQHKTEYEDKSNWPLRYGKILIMTDQDYDGSHIKGLIMNLFHSHWPSLLKIDFINTMITPIVKAQYKKKTVEFYNLQEYRDWKETQTQNWNIKYYKGLGTSTSAEAKEYFKNLHIQNYTFSETDSDLAINLAFNKSMSPERKLWLSNYNENQILDFNKKDISYEEFVNKELIHFSNADCARSIPDMRDGLKPSQRKVLFSCFKKKLFRDIKVSQLSGYVSETSCYHHGEVSLQGTIINLAQNFVGANNINLLVPSGQFGSRLKGGKDSASPRYIFTRLNSLTISIFPEIDNNILTYLNDDGVPIEPKCYLPIIPMILVNGARGIGTGYSCNIPQFNPLEVINNIIKMIDGKEIDNLKPWYYHFNGSIDSSNETYYTKGIYQVVGNYDIEVTELPIGKWTQDYKEYLDKSVKDKVNESNKNVFIKSFEDHSTEDRVLFKIKLLEPYIKI